MEKYDKVTKDQLEQGIVKRADENPTGREFYIPHKPVVRESAESTKLRVVYDASARDRESSPSLNECLNPGPPLRNQLWNVLVRARFHPVLITGDLKQAFLQVRIHEQDRDALRFHWLKDLRTKEIEVLRFTRALFGLAPSPVPAWGSNPTSFGELSNSLSRNCFRSKFPRIYMPPRKLHRKRIAHQ